MKTRPALILLAVVIALSSLAVVLTIALVPDRTTTTPAPVQLAQTEPGADIAPTAPAFDWTDECPASVPSVPDARDPRYGVGEPDPVAFARREIARLTAAGREMEPYRNGEAGERATIDGMDMTGVRESGCMQRRFQAQTNRLQGWMGSASHRLREADPDAAERLFSMIPMMLHVHRCTSGLREGEAILACAEAEHMLRTAR